MNSKESLDALFENPDYLRFYKNTYLSNDRLIDELDFISRFIGLHPEMLLLDLGCGTGRHCVALSNRCRKVVGVDRSQKLINTAIKASEQNKCNNIEWVCSDIEKYSSSESYDRIILMNTIIGLEDDAATIRILGNAGKMMSSRGKLCFDVLNRDAVLTDFQQDGIEDDGDAVMLDQIRFEPLSASPIARQVINRV